ncbi:DUF4369 domain-containing protein [Flavobacteriaceae bacterium R38]|nr:DUF4369 domain-containing protein [Flavobacteriaceae bacterium R38]
MRLFLIPVLVLLAIVSCSKDQNRMNLSGTVEGLKKGTIYLQKTSDTTLIVIDSVVVDGDSNFSFSVPLESPEVFYLYLDKNDGNTLNDRITFFGEVGDIVINTKRGAFEGLAKVTGSKTNEKFMEYRNMISNFNTTDLKYYQESIKAQRDSNVVKFDSIQKLIDRNNLRSYLYTLNFALTNGDSYVAPYIALSEAFDARLKYLDTINNALTPEVANSIYGKKLQAYIKEIKENEKTNTEN